VKHHIFLSVLRRVEKLRKPSLITHHTARFVHALAALSGCNAKPIAPAVPVDLLTNGPNLTLLIFLPIFPTDLP
jgi:hypothetical protein